MIRGEGMPVRRGVKGDLYIRFDIEMPGESWASRQDIIGSVSLLSERWEHLLISSRAQRWTCQDLYLK